MVCGEIPQRAFLLCLMKHTPLGSCPPAGRDDAERAALEAARRVVALWRAEAPMRWQEIEAKRALVEAMEAVDAERD